MGKIVSIFTLTLFLLLALTFGSDAKASEPEWLIHLNRFPDLEAIDLYKFVYQAAMGPAHMGTDSLRIRRYLNYEMQNATEFCDGDTVLFEPIGNGYVRLHIHPYLEADGTLEKIAAMQFQSASIAPDSSYLRQTWCSIVRRSETDPNLATISESIKTLNDEFARNGFSVAHHSEKFRNSYKPHYRVIKKKFIIF